MKEQLCKATLMASALALAIGAAYAAGTSEQAQTGNAQQQQAQGNAAESNQPATSGDTAASGATSDDAGQGNQAAQTSGATGGAAKGTGAAGNAPPVVYMMVPIEVASQDEATRNGCWARIHSGENFAGDSLMVVGPTALPDMDITGPFGMNWDDRVNSIETGPQATVTVYDNENYRDQVSQFKPGQRVADLSRRLGFFDEFASIKVDCQRG